MKETQDVVSGKAGSGSAGQLAVRQQSGYSAVGPVSEIGM